MKDNSTPLDILDMDFNTITFAGEQGGKRFSPVNPHATLLAIKGAEVSMADPTTKKTGFFQRIGAAFGGLFANEEARKGYFTDYSEGFKYPVADGLVKDDVDNDNDAADDYNSLYAALNCVGYDLSNATCISDERARAEAVKSIIDGFLKDLDAYRADDTPEDAQKVTKDVPATEAITTPAAESAEKGEVEMTDAEKAALLAELDTKIADAVKAAVDPLNEKATEQAAKIAEAEKAASDAKEAAEKATADAATANAALEAAKAEVATANEAKKAAEDALADATTKARARKAAGGHDDGAIDNKDALKAQLKDNPNLRLADAVKTLMAGTPLNPAV
jgi:chemotaxis protein histidine kinase CheA